MTNKRFLQKLKENQLKNENTQLRYSQHFKARNDAGNNIKIHLKTQTEQFEIVAKLNNFNCCY